MKKLFASLLIGLLAFPMTPARAALTEPDRSLFVGRNLLVNPGAEASTAGIVASTSAHLTTTTSSSFVGSGNASFKWSPTASGETLTFGFVTIGGGIKSQNAAASCRIWATTAGHTIQMWDGTSTIAAQSVQVNANSPGYLRTTSTGSFAASGNVTLQLTSGAADTIYIDDCYLGLAEGFNLSQVSQAQWVGRVTITGCSSSWSISSPSTTPASFSAQTGCSYATLGGISAPSTNVPGFSIANGGSGLYRFEATGSIINAGASTSAEAEFRFSDGTNATNLSNVAADSASNVTVPALIGSINETSALSNVTVQIQGAGSAASAIPTVRGSTANPLVIDVYRFPSQSQTVLGTDRTAASWSGYHSTDCSWSMSSQASYTDFASDASCTFATRTNKNFGTVTSTGANTPGISFTPPKVGSYLVKVSSQFFVSAAGGAQGIQLVDGSGNVLDGGTENVNLTTSASPFTLTGILNVTSVGTQTVRILGSQTSANTMTIGNGGYTEWSIFQLDAGQPAPLLIGSVTSNSAGQERVERATVLINAGSSSVNTQSGSWLSFSSYSSPKTTFSMSGFSGTPTCSCTPVFSSSGIGTSTTYTCNVTAVNSSSLTMYMANVAGSEAFSSSFFASIICMGPR